MQSQERAALVAEAAAEKKARDILVLEMADLTLVTDYFVIASADSTLHVRAVADAVRERLLEAGYAMGHQEGYRAGRWILQDYGDVVFHCFLEEERAFYDLERLWGGALSLAQQR